MMSTFEVLGTASAAEIVKGWITTPKILWFLEARLLSRYLKRKVSIVICYDVGSVVPRCSHAIE